MQKQVPDKSRQVKGSQSPSISEIKFFTTNSLRQFFTLIAASR